MVPLMTATKTTVIHHPCGVAEIVLPTGVRIYRKRIGHNRDFEEYRFTVDDADGSTTVKMLRKFRRLWIKGKDLPMVEDLPESQAIRPL